MYIGNHSATNDNIFRDYCDASHFKEHELYSQSPCSLQIILYYDEVELCNPLGSCRKKHKLGKNLFA